jgi:hypothetical protein
MKQERLTQTVELVREGLLVAEVQVTLIETDHEWAPYISGDDVRKLDEVRRALRCHDIKAAARLGRVYEMRPLAAE